jgi:hypothetical protein
MARKSYTPEQKKEKLAKVKEMRKAGKKWSEILETVGVAKLTLTHWQKGKPAKVVKSVRRGEPVMQIDAVTAAVLATPSAKKALVMLLKTWAEKELAGL